jgi:hypothetical protein
MCCSTVLHKRRTAAAVESPRSKLEISARTKAWSEARSQRVLGHWWSGLREFDDAAAASFDSIAACDAGIAVGAVAVRRAFEQRP